MIILLILSTFALYLATLSGTVSAYRDAGDMINAVSTLGIAHPPGYPFYVVLGKLFTAFVPWANPAYRVNVFSAFAAAASSGVLYWVLRRLIPASSLLVRVIGFFAALTFALTPAVVSLARVSEMYALAALFAAAILACYAAGTPQSLQLGCFLLGCGFGVHPILLFLAPLFIPSVTSGAGGRNPLLIRSVFFLLGFSIVLFLLFRSRQDPVQNWGNPSTLHDLWRLITRSNYGGLKLHPAESVFSWTPKGLAEQGVYFLQTLKGQWGWAGMGVGALGMWSWRRSHWKMLLCWALAGPAFFALSNLPIKENTTAPILEPYLLLVNLIWGCWLAQGVWIVAQRIKPAAAQTVVAGALLALPLVEARSSFQSYRHHFFVYDLARNMLRTLPPGAVLYDPDDPISFTLRVLQLAESRRRDVVLLNFFRTQWGYEQIRRRWPDLLPPVTLQSAQELERVFWNYSIKKRPFYADLPVKVPAPMSYQVDGIVYPILTAPAPVSAGALKRSEDLLALYAWRGVWRTTRYADFFTRQVFNYRAAAYCNLGLKYAEINNFDAARDSYRRALSIDPHLSPAYNDLGVADFQQRRYATAAEHYRWALRYDPGNEGYRRNLELAVEAGKRN